MASVEGVDANYEVWLCDPRGRRLENINYFSSLQIVKTTNALGAFAVDLPHTFIANQYDLTDMIIEVWRSPREARPVQEIAGFIRYWERIWDQGTLIRTYLAGPSALDLLKRRIVAYAVDLPQAFQTDYADNILKDIIRENLGSSASDSNRNLSSLGLTVDVDSSMAAQISVTYGWQPVLDVCQKIAAASKLAGVPLYFDLEITSGVNDLMVYIFKTYTGQRGDNRVAIDNVRFGPTHGNVSKISLSYDRTEEKNVVYGGGQGEGSERVIYTGTRPELIDDSMWNRCEAFKDSRSSETIAEITSDVREVLEASRPKIGFTAQLRDTEYCRYGVDWNWGDLVTIEFDNQVYEARIEQVVIKVDSTGHESIDALAVKSDV